MHGWVNLKEALGAARRRSAMVTAGSDKAASGCFASLPVRTIDRAALVTCKGGLPGIAGGEDGRALWLAGARGEGQRSLSRADQACLPTTTFCHLFSNHVVSSVLIYRPTCADLLLHAYSSALNRVSALASQLVSPSSGREAILTKHDDDVVICSAVRTPFTRGKKGGFKVRRRRPLRITLNPRACN